MGILINEAFEKGLISEGTKKLIPTRCKCGAVIEFSDSLRELKCTNEECNQKTVYRVEQFCKKINIGISHNDIENAVERLKIITPYQLMMLDEAFESDILDKGEIQNAEEIIQSIKNIKQNSYLIYEIVEFCGIDNISSIAKKLFFGFNSVDEAYNEIENGQIVFVNERLGIRSSDSSMISIKIYEELLSIKEELLFAETQFKVKEFQNVLRISFADSLIPFVNRWELLDVMNYKYNYTFVPVTTIAETTDILIRNSANSGSKVRTARLINDKHIAELMNKGEINLSDINKKVDTDLKPAGCSIYIDSIENVLNRLDYLKELDK